MSMGNRRYSFVGALTSAASTTRAALIGAASVRAKTNFLMLSATNATPNDYVNEYSLRRVSAIGSLAVSSTTANPLDPIDTATALVGGVALTGINATGEPTYGGTLEMLIFSHNMHAVFAWYAPDGGEITQEAVVTKGLGLLFVGGTTAYNDKMTWHYSE
jgi:hypothetical protein